MWKTNPNNKLKIVLKKNTIKKKFMHKRVARTEYKKFFHLVLLVKHVLVENKSLLAHYFLGTQAQHIVAVGIHIVGIELVAVLT